MKIALSWLWNTGKTTLINELATLHPQATIHKEVARTLFKVLQEAKPRRAHKGRVGGSNKECNWS